MSELETEAKWYVVHTYSGYENKVKADIEKTIENRKLQDQILEVCVPLQEVTELKDGKKNLVNRKLFPSYVLLYMKMSDENWYIVRNTRGVTGFVGPGSKPVPLTETEIETLGIQSKSKGGMEIDIEVGDMVVVTSGLWEGTESVVTNVDMNKQTVSINIEAFGRATPVEVDFLDVKKL